MGDGEAVLRAIGAPSASVTRGQIGDFQNVNEAPENSALSILKLAFCDVCENFSSLNLGGRVVSVGSAIRFFVLTLNNAPALRAGKKTSSMSAKTSLGKRHNVQCVSE